MVSDLFSQQCALTPHAPALCFAEKTLTYRELDQQSDALATLLASRGIGPGSRVGICITRGIESGIALLGCLKLGAAYVPLDPAYPRQRLQMMVADSRLATLLVSSIHSSLFAQDATVLTIEDALTARAADHAPLQISHDSSLPAYIIYTSGSTGMPKGVVMPHCALLNLIQWQIGQPGFSEPARTLQFTPLGFDVHFQEFFATWATGGTVLCISEETRRDATKLLAFIIAQRIEKLFLPFVALQQLAEVACSYGPLPISLRHVVTAGEQLQVNRTLARLFGQLPNCRLHNQYGPSESHVVSAYTLPDEVENWPVLPPIGRAIDNTRLLILDPDLHEVNRGATGELLISGSCLATGYWRRDELTAQRFISHPAALGGIAYRSGDLVRMDDAGELHYLGRIDGQVKIRGHRVETGEIETRIRQHIDVSDCAVIASDASGGDRKLLAYLVLDARPREVADPRQQQQLAQWQGIWDGTYQQPGASTDVGFDISGWNSSFDGRPLDIEHMRQWVAGTATRILAANPHRVLEIGAGTGLILFAVAPHCDYYHATDYSRASIARLEQNLAAATPIHAATKTSVLAADQLMQLQGEQFDTIILNSVTQHFVSVDYLITVLRQATALLAAGGQIFIGDITSQNTRRLFSTRVECSKAAAADLLPALHGRIEKRLGEESELVLDPLLFYRLAEEIDAIRNVSVQLKPGDYDNELVRYRYDVVLDVGPRPIPLVEQDKWLDWQPGMSIEVVEDQLANSPDGTLGIRNVPNARLQYDATLATCLEESQAQNAGELQQAANQLCTSYQGVHPDEFLALQQTKHIEVQLLWSHNPACFDVLLSSQPGIYHRPPLDMATPLQRFASQPLNSSAWPQIVKEVRRDLATTLPDYMQPAKYLLLQRLPLTPSGKLDRRALPVPSTRRPVMEQEFVAAQTPLEHSLAAIWAALLDLDEVGMRDNFFELGGNSILSLRMGLEIRRNLELDVPVVTLFQYPTVGSLAAHLHNPQAQSDSLNAAAKQRAARQKQAFSRGKRPPRVNT